PEDLWGVLVTLGLAIEAFGSFFAYLRLWHACPGPWGGLLWGRPSPEVPQRLKRGMLRRRRGGGLAQRPPKQDQALVVGLEDGLRGSLDDLWQEYADLLTADELPPFEKFSAVREKLARSRAKPMLGLVEQFEEQGEPLVVFSAHRAPVESLAGRPGWAVITGDTDPQARQAAVSAFQAGD